MNYRKNFTPEQRAEYNRKQRIYRKRRKTMQPVIDAKRYTGKDKLFHLDDRSFDAVQYSQTVLARATNSTGVTGSVVCRLAVSLLASKLSGLWDLSKEDFKKQGQELDKTLRILGKGSAGSLAVDDLSNFGERIPPFKILWKAGKAKVSKNAS